MKMKRKKIRFILLFALFFLTGESVLAATAQKISLQNVPATLLQGKTSKAKVFITPKKASQKVTYKSSNQSILTVTSKGEIKAKKVGKVKLTVTSQQNKKLKLTKTITVKPVVKVKAIQAKTATLKLETKKSHPFYLNILPQNATNKKVTYQSANPNIAKVSAAGHITGVAVGKTTIQATTEDAKKTTTIAVEVTPVKVTGINAWAESLNIEPGQKMTLWEQVLPVNASNQGVSWTSSNPKIATTTKDGYVTAVSEGKVTFSARTSEGGFVRTVAVEVKKIQPTTDVLNLAKQLVGKPYVWGAAGPHSFDCSGFLQYLFKQTKGVEIGRTTWEQAAISEKKNAKVKKVTRIEKKDIEKKAQPGDLLFYNTQYEHSGLYVGKNQMIHAPLPGGYVEVLDLKWLPADFALRIEWK